MAMNRSQMISILNSMSDDSLATAMGAVGIDSGHKEEGYDLGEESADGLESWNDREVKMEPSPRPPILDKSKFETKPDQQKGMRDYGAGEGDLDELSEMEYMPQEGMVEQ